MFILGELFFEVGVLRDNIVSGFIISCILRFLIDVSCDLTSYLMCLRKMKEGNSTFTFSDFNLSGKEKEMSQGTASWVETSPHRRTEPVGNLAFY